MMETTLEMEGFYFIEALGRPGREIMSSMQLMPDMAHETKWTRMHTCCVGANWALLELTGDVCEVNTLSQL